MLTSTAMRAGFSGGLVVDFPHSTRAKKYFLVLMVGSSSYQPQAKGINGEESDEGDQEVQVANRQRSNKRRKTANGNIQVMLLQASTFTDLGLLFQSALHHVTTCSTIRVTV